MRKVSVYFATLLPEIIRYYYETIVLKDINFFLKYRYSEGLWEDCFKELEKMQ